MQQSSGLLEKNSPYLLEMEGIVKQFPGVKALDHAVPFMP